MRFGVHIKIYLFSLVLLVMSASLFSLGLHSWVSEGQLSLYLVFLFPCVWAVVFLYRCASSGIWVDDQTFCHKHYENGYTNELKPSEVVYYREGQDKNAYVFIELLDKQQKVLDMFSERYIQKFEVLYMWARENFLPVAADPANREEQEKV